jgi:TetR/AcrR family transcriptional regulator
MPPRARSIERRSPASGAGPTTTQSAILDAAEELFATHGFAATSIKQIGHRASANTALLYYYYGDKIGLYRAVLARLGEALSGSAASPLAVAQSPADVVGALVRAQVELMVQHPRAATLIVRELIDHQAKHAQPLILKVASGLFRPAVMKLDQGRAMGTVRPDLDPGFATISTIAQLVYFVLAQPVIRKLLGKDAHYPSPADIRAFGRHAEAFAMAAVGSPGRRIHKAPKRASASPAKTRLTR